MFKDLKGVFGFVNLNDVAKEFVEKVEEGDLLDSDFCMKVVKWAERKYGVEYTYGGWMENRSFLWKGSYLENTGNFVHLGVDFNVPHGTKVYANHTMEVVHVENDFPLRHGWGYMVIGYIKEFDVCILYAHLSRENNWKVGETIMEGGVIGIVGDKEDNGFWFPHLHVQTISNEYFQEVKRKNAWKEFDGYGHVDDMGILVKRYKDPMNYVRM